MKKAIIQVNNLVKKYGDFEAVKGISFDVMEGEIFGLLGPNGAGKTTTMRMIAGFTDRVWKISFLAFVTASSPCVYRRGNSANFVLFGSVSQIAARPITMLWYCGFFAGSVMMIGSNDRQSIRDGQVSNEPRSPRWKQIYASRIEAISALFKEKIRSRL